MSEKDRIIEIDYLRGFAAISLIVAHSIITVPINLDAIPWCHNLNVFIYSYDMPLFFTLAGYVYKCKNYKEYVKKKIIHIGIPYICFGLFSAVLQVLARKIQTGESISLLSGIYRLILYGGNYWFLYTLLIIYFIFPFLCKWLSTKNRQIGVFALLIILRVCMPKVEIFTLTRVFTYLPYFYFGYLLEKSIIKENNALVLILIPIYIFGFYVVPKYYFSWAIEYISIVCFILSLFIIVKQTKIFIRKKSLLDRFLFLCSRYSLQLYLINIILEVAIRYLVCAVIGINNPFAFIFLSSVFNFAVTIPICLYIAPKFNYVCAILGIIQKRRFKEEL